MDFQINLFSDFVAFIKLCIYLQAALILVCTVFTLGALLHRHWRTRQAKKLNEIYGDAIVMELLRISDNEAPATGEGLPDALLNHAKGFPHEVLKSSLLEHMRSVTGHEREHVEALYRLTGCEQTDLSMCRSKLWWRRLKAVAHLTSLSSTSSADMLYRLTKDRSELVAGAALLALSRVDHPLNHPNKWSGFPPSLLKRRNVFCEILQNVAKFRGNEYLLLWLKVAKNDEFKSIILQVILTLKAAESVELLCTMIDQESDLSAPLVCEVLAALRAIGDPVATRPAWRSFGHADSRVRARAAELLLGMEFDREAEILSRMETDESAEVRRIAVSYRRKQLIDTGAVAA